MLAKSPPQNMSFGDDRSSIGTVLFGACSIVVGIIFSMQSVPEDVRSNNSLVIPAMYLTIALLIPVALQLRSDLSLILRVQNALMLGIVYWLLFDMLQSAYPFAFVTREDVQSAFGMVGAFAAAVWLGASGRGWALPRVVARTAVRPISIRTLYSAVIVAFILGMANFVISSGFNPVVMLQGLGATRWGAPWARGDLGGADAFLDHMQYFGYILPSLCVLIALRTGWFNWRVITGLILSAVVMAFLAQSGGRRIIGVVIGAAVFTWMSARPRLGSKLVFGVATAAVFLLVAMQEMLRYRNVGFGAILSGDRPQLPTDYIHVDDNFLRLSQLIHFFPKYQNYVFYKPILQALTLPIPRLFWPGKPIGAGFDLVGLLGMQGVSLSCSIVGELYVSFGLLAVVAGGWVLGRIAGMWNKILQLPAGTGRPMMYGLGLMTLFAGLRSMQALVQMSYIVLAWILIASLVGKSAPSMNYTRP